MSLVGFDGNVNVDTTKNNTNVTQISTQKILNNSELYNEISTSYEKAFEVINKVRNEINKANEAMAKASTDQTNNGGGIKITGVHDSTISLSQKNKAEQNVSLIASVRAINDLDATNKQKAIIADMVGLTQSANNDQAATSSLAQDGGATNDTTNKTEQFLPIFSNQYLEKFGLGKVFSKKYRMKKEGFSLLKKYVFKETAMFGTNFDVDVSTTINDTNMYQSNEQWNETNTKNTNIQQYASSLTEKTENIDENVQNLQNNMAAAAEASQTNDFGGVEIGDSSGLVFSYEQSNELIQNVTMEYTDFMETVKKAINEGDVSSTTDTTGDQSTANKQSSDSISDQKSDVENKTLNESKQGGGIGNIIMIVVIIAVVAGLGGILFKGFMSKEAFYDGNSGGVSVPGVKLPGVSVPGVKLPGVSVPGVKLPTIPTVDTIKGGSPFYIY